MDEDNEGIGEVFEKETHELLASKVPYQLQHLHGGDLHKLADDNLRIDLDPAFAMKAVEHRTLLTLQTENGRYLDFQVTRTTAGYVEVAAVGALRAEW